MAENDTASAIVLRHGTVLTMDADHRVLTDADVLVVDDQIAAVGAGVEAPPGSPRRSTPAAASSCRA